MTTRQLDHFYEQIKIIQKVSVQTKWFPGSKLLTFLISLKFLSHTRSFIIILPLILNLSPLNLSLQIVQQYNYFQIPLVFMYTIFRGQCTLGIFSPPSGPQFSTFHMIFLHWLETNRSPADLAIFTTFIFHFHGMLCHGAVAIQQLCESIQLCKVSNWNYVSGGGELRTLTVVHSAPEYFHCKINFIRRHRGPGSIYYISPILK